MANLESRALLDPVNLDQERRVRVEEMTLVRGLNSAGLLPSAENKPFFFFKKRLLKTQGGKKNHPNSVSPLM